MCLANRITYACMQLRTTKLTECAFRFLNPRRNAFAQSARQSQSKRYRTVRWPDIDMHLHGLNCAVASSSVEFNEWRDMKAPQTQYRFACGHRTHTAHAPCARTRIGACSIWQMRCVTDASHTHTQLNILYNVRVCSA